MFQIRKNVKSDQIKPENQLELAKNEQGQRLSGGSQSDGEEDEADESVGERIWGLTEMFPESVRNFAGNVFDFTQKSIQGIYKVTCTASWIFFTSSMILFAPVIFETERAQMDELNRVQQKQVLLGPGAAVTAVHHSGGDLPPIR